MRKVQVFDKDGDKSVSSRELIFAAEMLEKQRRHARRLMRVVVMVVLLFCVLVGCITGLTFVVCSAPLPSLIILQPHQTHETLRGRPGTEVALATHQEQRVSCCDHKNISGCEHHEQIALSCSSAARLCADGLRDYPH